MNWIGALASKTKKAFDDADYDEAIFGVRSERGDRLEILDDWLRKGFWNFDLGHYQFDGASEGICILAGIDPERSMLTTTEYGPYFLPDTIGFYGYEKIIADEQSYLKEAVDRRLDDLKSLGLKGRVHCRDALETCELKKLDPPWLVAANNDFECAKKLPFRLRTNHEIIQRISREASSKGGQMRAKKDAITKLLNTEGLCEFNRLKKENFPGCWTNSRDRTLATKIADKIYYFLSEKVGDETENLPKLTTVQSAVRKWQKNLPK